MGAITTIADASPLPTVRPSPQGAAAELGAASPSNRGFTEPQPPGPYYGQQFACWMEACSSALAGDGIEAEALVADGADASVQPHLDSSCLMTYSAPLSPIYEACATSGRSQALPDPWPGSSYLAASTSEALRQRPQEWGGEGHVQGFAERQRLQEWGAEGHAQSSKERYWQIRERFLSR